MKCIYCNKELREGAKFCSECGLPQYERTDETQNNTSGKFNPTIVYMLRNRKKLFIVILIILATVLGISFAIPKNKANVLVGTWKDNNNYEISFSENKKFTKGTSTSGTYEIYENNKLVMIYHGFDYIDRDTWTYVWSKENKGEEDYWYVSGNTLYIGNNKYTKR